MNKNKEDFTKECIEYQKDHVYSCLVQTPDIEAWRCKKPDTSTYAFDILITRFGIAVVGDIGDITFSVGKDYGLPFLAGNDVGYYILSKLNENCKQREFSVQRFYEIMKNILVDWINEHAVLFDDIEIEECFEKQMEAFNENSTCCNLVLEYLKSHEEYFDNDFFNKLLTCLVDIEYMDLSSNNVHEWLMENEEILGISDSYEYNFESINDSTLFQVYMINHASKEIMKIRKEV